MGCGKKWSGVQRPAYLLQVAPLEGERDLGRRRDLLHSYLSKADTERGYVIDRSDAELAVEMGYVECAIRDPQMRVPYCISCVRGFEFVWPRLLDHAEAKRCEGCGRLFATWPKLRIHVCSAACARERRNRPLRKAQATRACAGCGKSFTPKRPDALYHDAACKQRAYRKRRTTSESA
jgi:hypothetical protein